MPTDQHQSKLRWDSPEEEYALFAKINDEVLKSYSSLAQEFRTSADTQWINEHRSLISPPGSDTKLGTL